MSKTVVLGGGVIGLSLAYELACRNHEVTLVNRPVDGQASIAGAGILIPANQATALHPLEALRGMSSRLHRQWAEKLKTDSGIDNGYEACGGIYVARSAGEMAALRGVLEDWADFEIDFQVLSNEQLVDRVPPMKRLEEKRFPKKAVWVPCEAQIETESHLQALTAACQNRGVKFVVTNDVQVRVDESQSVSVEVEGKSKTWDACFVAAGAWSADLLEPLGLDLSMTPVRGQMVLYKLAEPGFAPVIYEGSRYLVPRRDGHVLAGATVEEVGFDVATTDQGISALKEFAQSLIPDLNADSFVRAWSGLRPATYDGFPYMGNIQGFDGLYVCTGHFKAGLHLSTGCAVVMADLMESGKSEIDLTPLSPNRVGLRSV